MKPAIAFAAGWCLVVGAAAATAGDRKVPSPTPREAEFFEKHVRPVLAESCFNCHGPQKHKSGLRLDSLESFLKGGDSGPVVVPGNPDASPMIQAVRYDGATKMPPKGKLKPQAVEALTAWVKMGVPWPKPLSPAAGNSG